MTIRVGIYDAPQVAVRAAPTVLQRAPSTAGLQQLGQGISAVSQAIDEEIKRADNARVLEFQNKLIPFMTVQENKVRALQGSAALKADKDGKSPVEPYFDEAKSFIDTSMKDLGNERQRREAAKVAEAHMAKFSAVVQVHVANEQQAYQKSVHLDNLKVSKSQVSKLSASPEDVKEYMNAIEVSVQELNPGMESGALVRENQSSAALGAVQDAINNRQVIKGRLDHLMEYMTPDDKAKATKLAETSDVDVTALRVAQAEFKKGMSQVDFVKIADKYSDQGKNVPLYKAVLSQLRDRSAAYEDAQNATDKSWLANVSEGLSLKNVPVATLRQSTLANKDLSDVGRARALEKLAEWQDHLEGKREENLFPSLITLITSPKFSGMSREEMLTSLPKFGRLAPQLFKAWSDATADGGTMKVSPQVVKAVSDGMRIDLKNKEQAEAFSEAILQTSSYFSQQSQGKGKYATEPPTPEEVAKELRFRASTVVVDPGIFWDTKKPLSKLTVPEIQKAAENLSVETKKIALEYWRRRGVTNPSAGDMLRAAHNLNALQAQDPKAYKLIHDTVFPPGQAPFVPDDWKEPR